MNPIQGDGWSVALSDRIDASGPIEVCCGDYATGPERLTVEEALTLRDALEAAVRAHEGRLRPCADLSLSGVPCVLPPGHLEKHCSAVGADGLQLRWQSGRRGPTDGMWERA